MATATDWKTVRVFISSTFRDMHAERDHLVRFVFPRLREQLLRRRIHLVDVDLRWGVTGDQDAFELCMDEIDRCHPRFIGILGARYGWIPLPRTVPVEAWQKLIVALGGGDRALLESLYAEDIASGVLRVQPKPADPAELADWIGRCNKGLCLMRSAGLKESELSITAAEIDYSTFNVRQWG